MPLPTSLQTVRQLLDERAKQLEEEIAAAQARGDDALNDVTDRKDEANERFLAVIGGAVVERDLAELREIALARERIADGRYGRCADCGVGIDPRRLLAQPTAARCTFCQGKAERRFASDPSRLNATQSTA